MSQGIIEIDEEYEYYKKLFTRVNENRKRMEVGSQIYGHTCIVNMRDKERFGSWGYVYDFEDDVDSVENTLEAVQKVRFCGVCIVEDVYTISDVELKKMFIELETYGGNDLFSAKVDSIKRNLGDNSHCAIRKKFNSLYGGDNLFLFRGMMGTTLTRDRLLSVSESNLLSYKFDGMRVQLVNQNGTLYLVDRRNVVKHFLCVSNKDAFVIDAEMLLDKKGQIILVLIDIFSYMGSRLMSVFLDRLNLLREIYNKLITDSLRQIFFLQVYDHIVNFDGSDCVFTPNDYYVVRNPMLFFFKKDVTCDFIIGANKGIKNMFIGYKWKGSFVPVQRVRDGISVKIGDIWECSYDRDVGKWILLFKRLDKLECNSRAVYDDIVAYYKRPLVPGEVKSYISRLFFLDLIFLLRIIGLMVLCV